MTYEPIATTTLGSAQSTITFSSIPGTYTDLRLVLVSFHAITGNAVYCRLNNDLSSIYSTLTLIGTGTNAAADRATNTDRIEAYAVNSTTIPTLASFDICSYAANIFKTVLLQFAADLNGSGNVVRKVGLYRSTTAISSINLTLSSGNFATGTTATLYGILAA